MVELDRVPVTSEQIDYGFVDEIGGIQSPYEILQGRSENGNLRPINNAIQCDRSREFLSRKRFWQDQERSWSP